MDKVKLHTKLKPKISLSSEKSKEEDISFKSLMDEVNDIVQAIDSDGRFVYVNKKWKELLGYTDLEIEKMKFVDILDEESKPHCEKVFKKLMNGEPQERIDTTFVSKNGESIKVRGNLSIIKKKGKVISTVGVFRDISMSSEVLRALRESEAKYSTVIESTADSICLIDEDYKYLHANKKHLERIGKALENVAGKDYAQFHYKRTLPQVYEKLEEAKKKRKAVSYEYESPRDGTYFLRTISPVIDADTNEVTGFAITSKDIGVLIQAESKIKESEERFRELFDHMSSGVAIYEVKENGKDLKFIFKDYNEAGQKLDKTPKEKVIGKDVEKVFPGVNDFGLIDAMKKVWKTGKPESLEMKQYEDDKLSAWRNSYVYKLPTGEIVSIYDDVTREKLSEQAMLDAKEQAETINRLIPSGLFTVDLNKRITSWNKAAEEITGYKAEEVIGKGCDLFALEPCNEGCGLFDDDIAKPIRGRECIIKTKSGVLKPILKNADILRTSSGKVFGGIETFEDISEFKKTQKQLIESLEESRKLNNLMIGRELKMIELKNEIQTLKRKLNKNEY